MAREMPVAVLMPTFHEGPATREVLTELCALAPGLGGIVVYLVDDGSPLRIELSELPESTADFDLVLARHALNLGQGAALETARRLACARPGHRVFVTMDSDGQHRAEDLPRMVQAIQAGADVAFGNRFAADSNVPPVRHVLLCAARLFEFALTRLWLADAHNGYRAFSPNAIQRLRISQDRMAHATEIRQCVARQRRWLKIVEVPVSIRYTPEGLAKGQSSFGAISILRDLAFRFLFGPR